MLKDTHIKPKKRSMLRLYLGRRFFTLKRYFDWWTGGNRFTKVKSAGLLNYLVADHQTPLYRDLKAVDQWLQVNKVANLKIASSAIHGVLIRPGETFSYWKTIGNPSSCKGYQKGMVLSSGKVITGVGGGLCQLSNMVFWMAIHSPLTVTERHRHSYDVFPDANRTQPFGSGATCVYNYRDLQITNETEETYQLILRVEDPYLMGEIRSNKMPYLKYQVFEKNHEIRPTFWGQYIRHNEICRRTFDLEGGLLNQECLYTNDALMMYDPLLEYGLHRDKEG